MESTFFDFGKHILSDTQFVVFGIPWDELTTINSPNSKIAPQTIRKISQNLALTTEQGKDISKLKIADIGDIELEEGNWEDSINRIEKFVQDIYKENQYAVPVMIGGDHFCTYPVFKGIRDKIRETQNLGILLFDAHLDLYEEWKENKYSHATVSHRIYDLDNVNNHNFQIVGCRDIDNLELEIAKKEKINYLPAYQLNEMGIKVYVNKVIDFFKRQKIDSLYVSIDVDVLDSSNAPATGYPIPGGLSYRELWQILRNLTQNFQVIGFDLVEVAPNLDHNNITSNLAAKIIIEFISFISDTLEDN